MNTYRTSEYSDRSAFRRRVETEDRRFHLELHGNKSRLPRMAILLRGLEIIEDECKEATHKEVKDTLRALFGSFDPMAEVNRLTIRASADNLNTATR